MDEFHLSYDGYIADEHRLDMRRLGYALVGLDHIISDGLIGLMSGRFPKGRERIDLTIFAEQPRAGSVAIIGGLMAVYQALQPAFPFVLDAIKQKAPDLVWHWLSATFKWLGGRHEEANSHVDKLVDFMREFVSTNAKDRQDERKFILDLIESIRPNAANVARPVGDSSRRLLIKGPNDDQTEIDSAMSSAIRSKDNLRVSDLREIEVKIDGLTKHSSRATLELTEDPDKFHYAEIKDPIVQVPGNIYFRAFDSGSSIKVIARMTYKGDDIHRVFVLAHNDVDDQFPHVAKR